MFGPQASLKKRMRITREFQGCSSLLGRTVNIVLLQCWGGVVCAISDFPGLCWWTDYLAPTTALPKIDGGLELGHGGASRGHKHVRWYHWKVSTQVRGAQRLETLDQHFLVAPEEELPLLVEQPHVAQGLKLINFQVWRDPSVIDVTLCDSQHHGFLWLLWVWLYVCLSVCSCYYSSYLDPRVRLKLMLSQYIFPPLP